MQEVYLKLLWCCHFLLKCLYQATEVGGHTYVLGESILPVSKIFDCIFLPVPTVWYLFLNILTQIWHQYSQFYQAPWQKKKKKRLQFCHYQLPFFFFQVKHLINTWNGSSCQCFACKSTYIYIYNLSNPFIYCSCLFYFVLLNAVLVCFSACLCSVQIYLFAINLLDYFYFKLICLLYISCFACYKLHMLKYCKTIYRHWSRFELEILSLKWATAISIISGLKTYFFVILVFFPEASLLTGGVQFCFHWLHCH